jgi:NTE family protein
MAKAYPVVPSLAASNWGKFDHTVMVFQGSGALGAYQAGIYAGLAEAGVAPDWIALIAGNPPERRVARLREFPGFLHPG